MKQGRAMSTTLAGKVEPTPHAVNVSTVSQIGLSQGVRSAPVYEGRGLEAPMVKETVHKSGSQGSR